MFHGPGCCELHQHAEMLHYSITQVSPGVQWFAELVVAGNSTSSLLLLMNAVLEPFVVHTAEVFASPHLLSRVSITINQPVALLCVYYIPETLFTNCLHNAPVVFSCHVGTRDSGISLHHQHAAFNVSPMNNNITYCVSVLVYGVYSGQPLW